jgi:hypothetical protein
MRGRNNNNNRKGPNPLTRSYESNVPDVKIRGSAQQIAEKYAALARDAQSAGDRVMAENYLQHAEHYNRIIAAAQAQMPIQNFRENRDEFDDEFDEEREGAAEEAFAAPPQGEAQPQPFTNNGNSPQPVIEGTPAEVALNPEASGNGGERPRGERPNGFHNNGYNSDDNYRRNRRSRRGRGGRQEAGEGGEAGEGPRAEGAGDGEAAARQPSGGGGEESAERPVEQAKSRDTAPEPTGADQD